MGQVDVLVTLAKRLPKQKHRTSDLPGVLIWVKKAIKYGIPELLMSRLNYLDLQSLVIDYEIETLQEHFLLLEQRRQVEAGIEIRDATNEDILRLHPHNDGR